jgi:DNA-binding transcriptional ArsR family regulator
MVEYSNLDMIFNSLADSTRRDILKRVSKRELTISELASPYTMSFAAIAKHVAVLESAKLVKKEKKGREQVVSASPRAIKAAKAQLEKYEEMWNDRFDALDTLLAENK